MTPFGKQIVSGMGVAALGAYTWAVVFSLLDMFRGSGSWADVAWFPLFGVFYASWFVLPFGILLGVLLPRLARRCSATRAIVSSAALGAGIGAFAAYLTTRFVWQVAFRYYAVTMIPFCTIWLAAWAWRLKCKETNERVA